MKSWIKFDIRSLDIGALSECYLRLTFDNAKSGDQYFDVSAVHDDYVTGSQWTDQDLTWNNAPGNNIMSTSGLLLDYTTIVGTVRIMDPVEGDQVIIDVLPILRADTDGIVQFVLHNSSSYLNLSVHDHPGGSEYWPALIGIPEPMTLTLLGFGSLVAFRKRTNRYCRPKYADK